MGRSHYATPKFFNTPRFYTAIFLLPKICCPLEQLYHYDTLLIFPRKDSLSLSHSCYTDILQIQLSMSWISYSVEQNPSLNYNYYFYYVLLYTLYSPWRGPKRSWPFLSVYVCSYQSSFTFNPNVKEFSGVFLLSKQLTPSGILD